MYPNLKLQIFRRGNRQYQLAEALGIDETVLSKIIHGHRTPTEAQRKRIASYLDAQEDWLFEEYKGTLAGSTTENPRESQEKVTAEDDTV